MSSFTIDAILASQRALPHQQYSQFTPNDITSLSSFGMLPFANPAAAAAALGGLVRPTSLPTQTDLLPLSMGLNPLLLEHHQQQLLLRAYQQRVLELERMKYRDNELKRSHEAPKSASIRRESLKRPASTSTESLGE